MGRRAGRPVVAVVLGDEERSYLERRVRGRRVGRGLSERCRIVLRCADGLTNKAVGGDSACMNTRSASGVVAS